jgi:hypothetical protein
MLAALATMASLGAATLVAASPANAAGKTQIMYVVSPHPDDVFESWSLIANSASNYPVFITMTQGESTNYCSGSKTFPYWPTFDTSTEAGCKGARMASLNNWLDDASVQDTYLNELVRGEGAGFNMTKTVVTNVPQGGTDSGAPTISTMTSCSPNFGSCSGGSGANPNAGLTIPQNLNDGANSSANARTVTWYVGADSARVQFDLGDGNLTKDEVTWALNYVRSERGAGKLLAQAPAAEYGVIAAGYSNVNGTYYHCYTYGHHDHRAIQESIYNVRFIPVDGFPHPQYGATCGHGQTVTSSHAQAGTDPDVYRVDNMDAKGISGLYDSHMLNSSSYFQNRFGWLSSGLWPTGVEPVGDVIFSQWQYHWRSFV